MNKIVVSTFAVFIIMILPVLAMSDDSKTDYSNSSKTSSKLVLDEIPIFAKETLLETPSETSSRLGLSIRETPASVHIEKNSVMMNRGYFTPSEAIERMPGIIAGNPPAAQMSFSMRGFSANQIHILRDGIWLGPAGMVGRPSNSFNLDRIEVLKGPASVLQGQGVIGGVINMVTKSPVKNEAYTGEVLASYGRFDNYMAAGGFGGPIGNNIWFRTDISQTGTSGYVDDGGTRSLNSTGSILWRPNDRFDVKFQYDFLDDDLANYWGTPLVSQAFATQPLSGVISTKDGRTLDRRMRFLNFNVADHLAESTQHFTRGDISFKATNEIQLKNTFYYFDAERAWANSETFSFNSGTGLIDRDRFFVGHEQVTLGNRFTAKLDNRILGRSNRTLVGVDYQHVDFVRNSRFFGNFDSVNPFNPTPGSFPNLSASFRNPTVIETIAVFMEETLKITDKFRAVAGFRYDHIDLDRDSFNLDGSFNTRNAFQRDFEPLSWRAGIVYDVTPAWSGYFQWSTGADPIGSNIFVVNGNQNFDLTNARQWEIGLKGSFLEDRGHITLAYFDIERTNILSPGGPGGAVQNIGSQFSDGVEVDGAFEITKDWNIGGNFAYTNANFGVFGANSGNTPPNVAKWTANFITSYQNIANLPIEVGAAVRYVGDRFGDNANIITLEDYTVADVFGSYTWGPVKFTAKVTNLFDEKYAYWQDPFYTSEVLLGAPRGFQLNAHYRF
ncbi:MAG: TonB-dependent receptor [Candidatus Nitronauta litoralis]|uniref:TonB-dependent receptor n=1 Tax=Candidatus Nitronauta litoralis TaxID=2705533 RepID=A0A7T0BX10_9BACT|nr:MAG: TonB-dependent receptor [Candidatus Nitronauta litoralis]